MNVRRGRLEDCEAIGRVHVEAWQAAYRGLMPDEYLDELDPAARAERWRSALAGDLGDGGCRLQGQEALLLVAENDTGAPEGISVVGPDRGGDDPSTGELWMINLLRQSWGSGVGAALLAAATEELRGSGYRQAVLWVLVGNGRARRFYEREGWEPDGARKGDSVRGFDVEEMRYRRHL